MLPEPLGRGCVPRRGSHCSPPACSEPARRVHHNHAPCSPANTATPHATTRAPALRGALARAARVCHTDRIPAVHTHATAFLGAPGRWQATPKGARRHVVPRRARSVAALLALRAPSACGARLETFGPSLDLEANALARTPSPSSALAALLSISTVQTLAGVMRTDRARSARMHASTRASARSERAAPLPRTRARPVRQRRR